MKLISRLALLLSICLTLLLSACGGVGTSSSSTPPPPDACGGQPCINKVNHVIVMFQENRSFDDYFGQMTAYRQRQGIPISSSDGKIDDLSSGSLSNQNFTTGQVFPSYHSGSVCTEDLTPDWDESHIMMNHNNPVAAGPGSPMDGFVSIAYNISQAALSFSPPLVLADQDGHRAMGYFDDNDLNYYYFMASNFAMSDRFFSPVPSRTAVNRLYLHAGTSQGHAHEPTTSQLTAKTIWQELDAAGVSWKIYFTDKASSGFTTYLSMFAYFNSAAVQAHVVPVSEYLNDVKNGTLPAVSFIETGEGRPETEAGAAGIRHGSHSGVDRNRHISSIVPGGEVPCVSIDHAFFVWPPLMNPCPPPVNQRPSSPPEGPEPLRIPSCCS